MTNDTSVTSYLTKPQGFNNILSGLLAGGITMTYAERELQPLGFRLLATEVDSVGFERKTVLSFGHLKLQFDCVCPAYPSIKALGCPLHHKGPGGSWPVEEAKKIPQALNT